jgi:peptidoglycan/LPS O-acetylase OafA/YrhL
MRWNHVHAAPYLGQGFSDQLVQRIDSWWEHIGVHIPLHLSMLHGVVPSTVVPHAPGAFLEPAWSISLEWQFYLIAPFVMAALNGTRKARHIACLLIVLLYLARRYIPDVEFGADLPHNIHFFFVGAVTVYVLRYVRVLHLEDFSFPLSCSLALILFVAGAKTAATLTLSMWLCFVGLILEPAQSVSARLLSLCLASRPILYVGRISYSVYLSHVMILTIVQYLLLSHIPSLTRVQHFLVLVALTLIGTLIVSSILYRWIELPFIKIGSRVAAGFRSASTVDRSEAAVVGARQAL